MSELKNNKIIKTEIKRPQKLCKSRAIIINKKVPIDEKVIASKPNYKLTYYENGAILLEPTDEEPDRVHKEEYKVPKKEKAEPEIKEASEIEYLEEKDIEDISSEDFWKL